MAQQDQSQFHAAEMAVQKRLGVAEQVAEYSRGFIRSTMPTQHRDFFNELPFAILGLVDKQGYPWAIPIFGQPGFISSPDDTTLTLNALPKLTRLLELDLKPGQKIGVLGIQLNTRRRNRLNGVIREISEDGFSIQVEQSFGNCPQYIQARSLVWHPNNSLNKDFADTAIADEIDLSTKSLIEHADTFFIASRTKEFNMDTRSGIDASHRGGKPGFVRVDGNVLCFPDFSGNRFFNTLGNIVSDGRVGIFFPNFSKGDAVFIVGDADVRWEHDAIGKYEGAERIVEVHALRVVHIPQFMALTGDLIEQSPALDHTGTWSSMRQRKISDYQPFKIVDKQTESESVTSFYLAPTNGASTEDYVPGQYLPIELNIPGQKQSVLRSYTLSRAPAADAYRISVKREPHGLASKALHDVFTTGDTINVGQPAGQFTLQQNDHAKVLISGGVGITPMIAMVEGLVDDFNRGLPACPVWFIHATQNSMTHAFAEYLDRLAKRHPWLRLHTIFSRPTVKEELGKTHHSEGYISIDLLKKVLPFDQFDFYLCGTEGFMRTIYAGLIATGVDKTHIFYEFFGEGSIEEADENGNTVIAEGAQVTFSKTGISGEWTPEAGSLLDFAEKQGLTPQYGCRSGNCGACACKLRSGKVAYNQKTNYVPRQGEILICRARPAESSSEVVIDI